MPGPHDENSAAPLVRKKSELTPGQYAHQRKMLIVFGAVIVVCAAVAVGVLHLIG